MPGNSPHEGGVAAESPVLAPDSPTPSSPATSPTPSNASNASNAAGPADKMDSQRRLSTSSDASSCGLNDSQKVSSSVGTTRRKDAAVPAGGSRFRANTLKLHPTQQGLDTLFVGVRLDLSREEKWK